MNKKTIIYLGIGIIIVGVIIGFWITSQLLIFENQTSVEDEIITSGKEIPFEKIDKCMNLGSYRKSGQFVINNQQEWEELTDKTKADSRGTARCPLPKIDFTQKTVIAVFQGEKPSGGYDIKITGVTENKNNVDVSVKEISPGPDCMTTSAIATPSHIIKISKNSKKIRFNIKKEINYCQQ